MWETGAGQSVPNHVPNHTGGCGNHVLRSCTIMFQITPTFMPQYYGKMNWALIDRNLAGKKYPPTVMTFRHSIAEAHHFKGYVKLLVASLSLLVM